MPKKPNKIDFEAALTELEQLVERLEKGDASLEQSLKEFERGIELTRTCQKFLRVAEQKVRILIDKEGQSELQPFDETD